MPNPRLGFLENAQDPGIVSTVIPQGWLPESIASHTWLTGIGLLLVACGLAACVTGACVWCLLRGKRSTPKANSLEEVQELRQGLLEKLDKLKENEAALKTESDDAAQKTDGGEAGPGFDLASTKASTEALLANYHGQIKKHVEDKLAKGSEVRGILENRWTGLANKAKSLAWGELNGAAGSVLEALEREEAELVLEWNETVDTNFPPISSLVGGVLAPAILQATYSSQITQIVFVLLPATTLCVWAFFMDIDHPCYSIPSLRYWVWTTAILGVILIAIRGTMAWKISRAQKALRASADEMRAKLGNVGTGITGVKEMFVYHSINLQRALIAEEEIGRSFMFHLVGFGALVWIFLVIWCCVLVLGWTFVPGAVAFHPSAKGQTDAYCGAWASVLAARIICIISMLFLVVNIISVFFWLLQVVLQSSKFQSGLMKKCESMDRDFLIGLPGTQMIAKGLLCREPSDLVSSRLAVALREKSQLAKECRQTQQRLDEMRKVVAARKEHMDDLQRQADEAGSSIDARADSIKDSIGQTMDTDKWKSKGKAAIQKAENDALAVENPSTEHIDAVFDKVTTMAKDFQQTDAYKSAIDQAEKAKAAALEQGTAAMKQGKAAMENLQNSEQMKQAMAMGKKAGEQAMAKGQEAARQLQDPEAIQAAARQAQAVGQQVLQSEAVQGAARQAQDAARQIGESEAVQGAARQAQDAARQLQQDGQAAARRAKGAADEARGR